LIDVSDRHPFITSGIHHVTAIAGRPQATIEFHARTLGLRLVKRTVNYDDPQTYHLYFGDALGQPGTVLTLFAWPGAGACERADGEPQRIGLRVPGGALGFWSDRLAEAGLRPTAGERFGERLISFAAPDGLPYELIEHGEPGAGSWEGSGIAREVAISGVHAVTLSAPRPDASVTALSAACGLVVDATDDGLTRLAPASGSRSAGYLDLLAVAAPRRGRWGAGSVHHVALRAATPQQQDEARASITAADMTPGEYKDRNYFRSLYFVEPSGSILEIATDEPGFTADEPMDELGLAFKLPAWLESDRQFLRSRLNVTASPEYADRFGHAGARPGRA